MSSLTPSAAASIINFISGKATATATTSYLAMYYGDPLGGGVEQTFNLTGYVNRVNMSAAFSVASTATSTNNVDIFITVSCITPCSVNYAAIMNAQSGGSVIASTPITDMYLIVGDTLKIPAGSLTITVS